MKKHFNRKSVFIALLLSFIFILLFPIGVNTLLYQKMESIIRKNTDRSSLAMLKQASDVIDHELQQVATLSSQISYHPKLSFILSQMYSEEKTNDIQQYYFFMKDIRRYQLSNTYVYDYFIYLPAVDQIVSPSIKTDSKTFYRSIYRYQDINYDTWKDSFSDKKQTPYFLPASTVLEGISPARKSMITYVQPLPYGEKPRGYLNLFLNERKILDVLQNLEWANQGAIYLLDNQNQVLTSTAKNQDAFKKMPLTFNQQSDVIQEKIENKEMIVSYFVSEQTKWKYVSVIPKSVVMKEVNMVKTLAVSLLLFCLAGGLAACFCLARYHYIPVRNLVESIVENVNKRGEFKKNEYHIIQESLRHSWDAERKLRDSLATQTPKVRENFFIRLLNGFVDPVSVNEESLQFMEVSFQSEDFLVMVIDIEEIDAFVPEKSEKQWAITRFIVSNICQELVSGNNHNFVVELGQKRLGLIINEENIEKSEQLTAIIQDFKDILKERFGILISVGVGMPHKGMNQIVNSYREAIQALHYRMIIGNHKIIYFNETNDDAYDYYYPAEIEMQLMNCIKIADFEQTEKILDQVFAENFLTRRISLSKGKCLFFNMMSTHVKILNDMKVNHQNVFGEEQDPVQQVLACQTVEEIHEKIKVIYQKLCEEMKEKRSEHSEHLLTNIINYIHKHYADPMISLTSIAEEMNITPQYLSSFFKKHQGENVTEFIAKIRIEAAKQLLENTTLTISQIAKQIGYANDIGLIRLFKKQEGITPGKYRTKLKKHAVETSS